MKRVKFYTKCIIALLLFTCLLHADLHADEIPLLPQPSAPVTTPQPYNPKEIHLEDTANKLVYTIRENIKDGSRIHIKGYTVTVTDPSGQVIRTGSFTNGLGYLHDAFFKDHTLFVNSEWDSRRCILTTIDPSNLKDISTHIDFSFSPSTSHKYILSVNTYPNFCPDPVRSTILSAAATKSLSKSSKRKTPESTKSTFAPVFPQENVKNQQTHAWVEDPALRYSIAYPFVWHKDKDLAATVLHRGKELVLAVFDFTGNQSNTDPQTVKVYEHQFDPQSTFNLPYLNHKITEHTPPGLYSRSDLLANELFKHTSFTVEFIGDTLRCRMFPPTEKVTGNLKYLQKDFEFSSFKSYTVPLR